MGNHILSLSSPPPHVQTDLLICLILHQMADGLHGQAGDNARDLAGRDYRYESAPAQTRHPAMAERNVWELPNSIGIVCLNDAQVNIRDN